MEDEEFKLAQLIFRLENEKFYSHEEARKRAFLEMLNREPPRVFQKVEQCELF